MTLNFQTRRPFSFSKVSQMATSTQSPSSCLLIMIRGFKKVGKTCLLRRMTGQAITETYVPTAITQQSTSIWRPKGRRVSLTLLDVVSVSPRLSTSSHGVPHGVILMYDPRTPESVSYAADVIAHTSTTIPIAILTNFQDLITADLHPSLGDFSNRCVSIVSSMTTNLGLVELSRWLELPLSLNVFCFYRSALKDATSEIARLRNLFATGRKQVSQTRSVAVAPRPLLIDSNDDGFWSDDDHRSPRQSQNRREEYEEIQMYASPEQAPVLAKPPEPVKQPRDYDDLGEVLRADPAGKTEHKHRRKHSRKSVEPAASGRVAPPPPSSAQPPTRRPGYDSF
jgi:hypothetical protein